MTDETHEAPNSSIQEETPTRINETESETPNAEEHKDQESETLPVVAEAEENNHQESETLHAVAEAEENNHQESETLHAVAEVEEHDHDDEEDNEAEQVDYARFGKQEFVTLLHNLDKETDFRKIMPVLKRIKPHFDNLAEAEREQALQKFAAEGGLPDDFKYQEEKTTKEFYRLYNQIMKNRGRQLAQLEEQKQKNLVAKEAILQKIRDLVEKGEETKQSIDELKRLQTEWKSIGAVPMTHTHELWAKFDAIVDRFYDNIKIHRELADLDRKKNLAEKLEICEKAEKLIDAPVAKAIKELNKLHEEYKHIGPVPRKEQEEIWKRFKIASDRIYELKREQSKGKDEDRKENLTKKWALCEAIKPYADFNTDRVTEWNTKAQEVLEIQKQWEAIRDIPQDSVKDVSKAFWVIFKKFFHNKNSFLHALDEEREGNLAKKIAICEEAETLIASQEDARKIADTLKQLQVKWREIGAVPSKYRDSIYDRFKKICDGFFAQRRDQFSSQEKEFEDNLKAKKAIIEKVKNKTIIESADYQIDIDAFLQEWKNVGFVPKKDKDTIQDAFDAEMVAFIQRIPIAEEEKDKLHLHTDMAVMQESPQASRKIQQREQALRRKISKIETDIDTLNNNMGFFAKSNKPNPFKADIERQIAEETEKLTVLKKQLSLMQTM